jgi:hypothetical protein
MYIQVQDRLEAEAEKNCGQVREFEIETPDVKTGSTTPPNSVRLTNKARQDSQESDE